MSGEKRLENREKILAICEGMFSKTLDVSLWILVYLGKVAMSSQRSRGSWEAVQKTDRLLENFNYETIKNAIKTSKRKGFIKKGRQGKKAPLEITQAGKRRLESVVPRYDTRRKWDKRFYLVTYDISEKQKKNRDLLRSYLQRIGCGMLQRSVWITPYNPKGILREFVEDRGLHGSIIVSDIGRDGSIGDESLLDLIVRVYKLEDLNDRYSVWLEKVKEEKRFDSLSLIQYLAILRDDPQLPFELYPDWWVGDKAYKKTKEVS